MTRETREAKGEGGGTDPPMYPQSLSTPSYDPVELWLRLGFDFVFCQRRIIFINSKSPSGHNGEADHLPNDKCSQQEHVKAVNT
jgi:hypothetical protein